jgi:hypothetical protein
MSLKEKLQKLIGKQSDSDRNELVKQMRFHQSWWRACVLAQDEGLHPKTGKDGGTIGSSIKDGDTSYLNFINHDAVKAVKETLAERSQASGKGMISEDRLYNNLLSSQPLCFNFFGSLKYNLPLATELFKKYYPQVKEITGIHFEFAPNSATNSDNSAHDIAFEFIGVDGQKGLIGWECKYTEPFSSEKYDKPDYKRIHKDSNAFTASYDECITSDFNQLFRNQLIVESALLSKRYDVVYSGLFCFENDQNALSKGIAFQGMLVDGKNRFKVVTFRDFIESLQLLPLTWETRQWTMELWARYCATQLSKNLM